MRLLYLIKVNCDWLKNVDNVLVLVSCSGRHFCEYISSDVKNVSSVQWAWLDQSLKVDIEYSFEIDPLALVTYLTLMFIQIL